MPTEINATARPRFSSRAAHGSRRQDAERVQQSPTERSGAVVEVVHEDLQLDREVHVVHGGTDRHVDDLRCEVEQRVDSRVDQPIGDRLAASGGTQMTATVAGTMGSSSDFTT